jgi:hypothetical protein
MAVDNWIFCPLELNMTPQYYRQRGSGVLDGFANDNCGIGVWNSHLFARELPCSAGGSYFKKKY